MKFKTSSGIKSIVGRDLITDRYIAIFELVKNSYDARATEVIVSFNTSKDSQLGIGSLKDGKIYIVDNGKGMSKDDLENKWLFLAYSDKKEGTSNIDDNINSEDRLRALKNRTYVGSKGIGRFSSDRLGAVIKIYTKVSYENIEHQLTVNWDDFEKSLENRFENIDVEYKESSILSRKDSSNYTILEISNLREDWEKDEIDIVINKLRRLKNPFIEVDDLNIYCGQNIFEKDNYQQPNQDYMVSSNIADVLKEKSINISAIIENNITKIILTDRGNTIYEIEREETSILKNIDKLNISINYLTTSAKSTFTKRMRIEPVRYGNIFMYLNNFQVNPYGEEHYDIFGLNIRKTQGYNRYLGTRELIGFISIYDSNKYFREASSRDNGFIENGYFKSLEDFYMSYIQRPLERYVQLINWGESAATGDEININSSTIKENQRELFYKYILKDDFVDKYFNSSIDFEKNKPEKIIERIISKSNSSDNHDKKILTQDAKKLGKQIKTLKSENIDVKKENKKVQENLSLLKKQNETLQDKRSNDSYGEQVTHHINILAERLSFVLDDLITIKNRINEEDKETFFQALDYILSTKTEMEVFRNLLLRSNLDLKSPKKFDWWEISSWYFKKGRQSYYRDFNVNCVPLFNNSNKWIRSSKYIDIVMMFENFYRNAYEHRASYIDFTFTDESLIISSNSTPIKDEYLDSIFELGFSTKENGTGIGLYQIKHTLKELGLNINVKNEDGLVKFIIS